MFQGGIQGCLGSDSGIPVIPRHLKRDGECSSASLGVSDGGGRGREGRARTRGQTPECPLLYEQWHGCIYGPAMAPERFQNLGQPVQQGGAAEKFREDSWHGLPPVPGSGNKVGGGVRETDDERGLFVPGAAEETGPVQGVWGGDGAWFAGGAHAYAAWESSGVDTELGSCRP